MVLEYSIDPLDSYDNNMDDGSSGSTAGAELHISECGEAEETQDSSSVSLPRAVFSSALGQRGARSAFTPYRPATVLTNLQRGNVETQTDNNLPERTVHQLAAQGELFAQQLISDPSVVFRRDASGLTPLMWACASGQLSTVCLLLEKGAEVNAAGYQGQTALLLAAANGHAHILKELLKAKASVDGTDHEGNTALMFTAFGNHVLCSHELLLAGADFTLQNSAENTAYDMAVAGRSKQVQALLDKHILGLLMK